MGATTEETAEQLQATIERLKLIRERAELQSQIAALAPPWWRRISIAAPLAAIVAAVIPVTTAIDGCNRKDRELALSRDRQAHELSLAKEKQAHEIETARVNQDHQIRSSYIERYEKPGSRLRTIRFVLATSEDPKMQQWAATEEQVVRQELTSAEADVSELETKLKDPHLSQEERQDLRRQLVEAKTSTKLLATLQPLPVSTDPSDPKSLFVDETRVAVAAVRYDTWPFLRSALGFVDVFDPRTGARDVLCPCAPPWVRLFEDSSTTGSDAGIDAP